MVRNLFGRESEQMSQDKRELGAVMERHGLFAGVPANKLGRLVPACRVKRYAGVPIKCACPDALHDAYIGLEGTTAITYELAGLEHVVELAGFGVVYNVGEARRNGAVPPVGAGSWRGRGASYRL